MILQKYTNAPLNVTLLIILSFLLSGCGFHIKHNSQSLSAKYPQVYVQSSNPNSDLTRFVKIRLRGAGIDVLTMPNTDATILKINGESRSSRTISLNVKAQTAEQEAGYNLTYSLQRPGFKSQSFTFSLYRDFVSNPAQALAKSREEEQLTSELRKAAADNIIYTMMVLEADSGERLTPNKKEPNIERSINGVAQ